MLIGAILRPTNARLVHLADEIINLGFAVTSVTAFNEMESLALTETTSGAGELEGPEEVVGLLEVRTDGEDFVDQIFHTDDTKLTKFLLDDLIVSEGNTLTLNLTMTTLVDEFTDRLQVGLTIGNVRLDKLQHLNGWLGKLNKDTVVDLTETEELHDLARLGGQLVDTLNTDNKGKLGLFGDVEGASVTGQTLKTDIFLLSSTVLLNIGFGTLEHLDTLGLTLLASFNLGSGGSSTSLLNSLTLLEDVLGDGGDSKGRKMVNISSPKNLQQDEPQPLVRWLWGRTFT